MEAFTKPYTRGVPSKFDIEPALFESLIQTNRMWSVAVAVAVVMAVAERAG